MPQRPVPPGPGRDDGPGREPGRPDAAPALTPAEEADWLAWCEAAAASGEPLDPDEEEPDSAAPWDADLDAIIAECRQVTAEEAALAARAARLGLPGGTPVAEGRRGPGQPGCGALAGFAAEAAGDDDRYQGASDDELAGAISAWDRVEAYAAARKLAAVGEFIRRRPDPGGAPGDPAALPECWDEFAVT